MYFKNFLYICHLTLGLSVTVRLSLSPLSSFQTFPVYSGVSPLSWFHPGVFSSTQVSSSPLPLSWPVPTHSLFPLGTLVPVKPSGPPRPGPRTRPSIRCLFVGRQKGWEFLEILIVRYLRKSVEKVIINRKDTLEDSDYVKIPYILPPRR